MTRERANIAAMSGYASGEQPEDPATIKLNTNENPYPPSPRIDSLLRDFDTAKLRRYPPAQADKLRQVAAHLHGVDRANIIATRGGDELLRLMITTFVNPGESIGMTEPTYSLYPVLAQIQDCPVVRVPLDGHWQPPDDMAERMNKTGARLVFLVNPHAPSGVLTSVDWIDQLAGSLDGLLLIDEAYVDFVSPDSAYDALPLLARHDNIVILRTLSKGYSLAGLRLGYGIGAESVVGPMIAKTRDSYNLDWLSQEIATTALLDQAHARASWHRVLDQRLRLSSMLTAMDFEIPQSESNFLLATPPHGNAGDLYRDLKELGILVRYFDQERLRDKLRITVGTAEENDRLVGALDSLFERRDY